MKVTGAGGAAFYWSSALPNASVLSGRACSTFKELPVRLDRLGSRVVLNIMRDIWN